VIETTNLKLIPCELRHFEAILSDQSQLERMLGVTACDSWFDFPGIAGIEALQFSYDYQKAHPEALGWWTYLFIHAKDQALIGYGGFKGGADEAGMVEIGYAICPDYQGRGLATEAARGLIDYAFSHAHVKMIDAHTLPERNASAKVLEKAGMTYVGTVDEPDGGKVWHWRLKREDWETRP
jgi:[ribosomal protein S5]-alanine N-acetyltransferase